MGIGSGLSGQLMMAPETTHGTYAAPTRGYEINAGTGDFGIKKGAVTSAGLRGSGLVARAGRRRVSTRHAEGSVTMDAMPTGLGMLLKQIFGGTPTAVQIGSTDAYTQTYTLADMGPNLGATIQLGVPDTGGTVHPYTYLGSRVTEATFEQKGGETPPPLNIATTWHVRDITEAQGLVSWVDPAEAHAPYAFADWECLLGDFGDEEAIDGVSDFQFKVTRKQKTDRYYAGDAGRRRAPILNDLTGLEMTINADYVLKADLADRIPTDEPFSMINRWTGQAIDEDSNFTLEIATPCVVIEGPTPSLTGGFEVVSGKYKLTILDDDDNAPLTVTYISTDIAL